MKPEDYTRSVIPIAHEELRLEKRDVETGRVQVRTSVDERQTWVRDELLHDFVEVRRVDIDREVDAPPQPREEGDTLIIPVLEEVLVVEKRLVLRQEIHVRRRTRAEPFERPVTLRRTRVDVERSGPSTPATPRNHP